MDLSFVSSSVAISAAAAVAKVVVSTSTSVLVSAASSSLTGVELPLLVGLMVDEHHRDGS